MVIEPNFFVDNRNCVDPEIQVAFRDVLFEVKGKDKTSEEIDELLEPVIVAVKEKFATGS